MKEISVFMKALADGLKTMAQGIESFAEKVENFETEAPSSSGEKEKEKETKKRGRPPGGGQAKSRGEVRDTSKNAMNRIYKTICNSPDGISSKDLRQKTGYDPKSIHNIVYRLKQEGKIASKRKGFYVKAD